MRQGCLLLGPQDPQKASIEVQLQQFYKTVTELNANCQLKSFLVGEWPGEWWSEYTLDSWLLSRAQIIPSRHELNHCSETALKTLGDLSAMQLSEQPLLTDYCCCFW